MIGKLRNLRSASSTYKFDEGGSWRQGGRPIYVRIVIRLGGQPIDVRTLKKVGGDHAPVPFILHSGRFAHSHFLKTNLQVYE